MTLTDDGARTIRVLEAGKQAAGAGWRPRVGDELGALLEDVVPATARERVQMETFQILARCLESSPNPDRRTGLVVGYVQSGKTLSFTTVAALARDNGFQLIILIAGTNNLLLAQSRQRLRRDLRLGEATAYERWRRIDVDTSVPIGAVTERIAACLAEWRDARVNSSDRATALVTVLKNWQDLRHLVDALAAADLRGVTALVVDDEADQASLNSRVRRGLESTTYHQLGRLRAALPRHTLLQYTATPQAPLLISIADSLSPDFCFLLAPGDEYVGGRDLFYSESPHIRLLSDVDADSPEGIAPPPGLLKAMASFFVGAAASRLQNPRPANRSMLIHPSRRIEPHESYRTWVTRIRQTWEQLLNRGEGDPDVDALITTFERERHDLLRTGEDLPPIAELVPALRTVLRRCQVEVLNADPRGTGIREIPWSDEYAWILIGGQLLDRGFTVEGLTVTYMSRPLGGGNADTLWQRARFLGYRGTYRPYIRIFVDQPTCDAFSAYVEHETHMRTQLQDLVEAGQPLREWRRRFLLDRRLSATRTQVLRALPRRVTFSDSWAEQKFPHLVGARTRQENWAVIRGLLDRLEMARDAKYRGREHQYARTTIRMVMDELLSNYRFEEEADAMRFSGLECQVSLYLDRGHDESEECQVYWMRSGEESSRKTTLSGAIDNVFSGRAGAYPGDDHLRGPGLTVQVHRLEVHDERGESLGADLPTLAIWVPARMAADVLIQPEEDV